MTSSTRQTKPLRSLLVFLTFACCASLTEAQDQPTPLQMNVLYRCPGGITYVITKCVGSGVREVCFWREEHNGQLVTEAYSQRTQMGGRLAACKVDSAPPSQQVQMRTSSQPTNPPYLVEMPTVERVKTLIQGTSPDDTLARQVAVFNYLPQIIRRMQDPHQRYGTMTPDEQRLTGAYSLAAYQMSQAYAKSHTPEQAREFEGLHNRYEMDGKFFGEWFNALFTPEFRAAYNRAVSGLLADYRAHVAKEQQAYEQATAQQQQQGAATQGGSGRPLTDPGAVALRECLESGRSQLECLGQGLKAGMGELTGGLSNLGDNATPKGLRVSGVYSAGNLNISFGMPSAVLSCGGLLPQPLPYTVEKAGNRLLVTISTAPKPLILTLKPDGKLAGPGPTTIAGRIQVGSVGGGPAIPSQQAQTHTTTVERQIDAADVPNHAIGEVHQNGMEYSVSQQVTTTSEPVWTPHRYVEVPTAPKTEHCNATLLPPTAGSVSVSDVLTKVLGTDEGKVAKPAPGLRFNGTYAGPGGLRIEFREDSATLSCGEAHVAEAYQVQDSGAQITVTVRHASAPVTLALEPNGALSGSGTVEVNGRVIVGHQGTEMQYAPRRASCSIGTLSLVQAAH